MSCIVVLQASCTCTLYEPDCVINRKPKYFSLFIFTWYYIDLSNDTDPRFSATFAPPWETENSGRIPPEVPMPCDDTNKQLFSSSSNIQLGDGIIVIYNLQVVLEIFIRSSLPVQPIDTPKAVEMQQPCDDVKNLHFVGAQTFVIMDLKSDLNVPWNSMQYADSTQYVPNKVNFPSDRVMESPSWSCTSAAARLPKFYWIRMLSRRCLMSLIQPSLLTGVSDCHVLSSWVHIKSFNSSYLFSFQMANYRVFLD